MGRARGVVAGAAVVMASSATAQAALTSSERGEIGSYVAEARPATAARVRALVARPDLTADESAEALAGALGPVTFTEGRAAYVHEMLFGPSSLPSRGVLAVAITRALVARADAVIARHDADLDLDAPSVGELVRLYGAIDADVANAGIPHGSAHDPNAGIPTAAYDDATKALAGHVARHPRWLRGDAAIPAAAAAARAQLAIALYDMMNDVPTRKVDAADKLGFVGPRRAMLTELGMLPLDDGHVEAARIDAVRAVVARMPAARADVEGIAFVELRPAVKGRAAIVALGKPGPAGATAPSPFPDDVRGPAVDPTSAALVRDLAEVVVRRAFDVRPELKAQAEKDAASEGRDARAALVDEVARLELDASAAVDVAMVRTLAGKPGAALLGDALGVLAAFATPAPSGAGGGGGGLTLPLGGGAATNVRLAPVGFATSFVHGGHAWLLAREADGKVAPKRDGAPLALAMLSSARTPVSFGTAWSDAGLVFAKMAGAPKAGVAPPGRVRLVGTSAKGVDAIATAAPGDDMLVEGEVTPQGNTAIAVRAIATPSGFKGVALVLDADTTPARASLRAWDEAGKSTEIAPPIDVLPSAPKYAVRILAKGSRVEARVGSQTLSGAIPAELAHGDVALVVNHGGSIDAAGWSVKKP